MKIEDNETKVALIKEVQEELEKSLNLIIESAPVSDIPNPSLAIKLSTLL